MTSATTKNVNASLEALTARISPSAFDNQSGS